ncbi:expressed unknown protein [Seminavis robusta]|uniref:Uncharacterized protein n=1 Tax=Seminavis robusta TaxID=568900 RepID=A0A9N8HKW7_9STRA|nr:expressed unknown protein [Seminavis robusta]|eukprot:Sro869_g213540.1 n/a (251) ;mRNA; f:40963-41715
MAEVHLHPGDNVESLLEDLCAAEEEDQAVKLTLYNLDVGATLAAQILAFVRTRLHSIRRRHSTPKVFTLEILGCTGCVDRIVEIFANGLYDSKTTGSDATSRVEIVERELILQHSNPNHFDAAVFVALGMALDCRATRTAHQESCRPPLRDLVRLRLYQPVLSEGKLWTLAQGIQHSQHLTELDLSSCRFTPMHINRATQYLADGLHRNQCLKHLKLDDCNLVDDQIVCFLEALQNTSSKIETLSLAKNK